MYKFGRIKKLPASGSGDAMRLASSEEGNELGSEISSLYIPPGKVRLYGSVPSLGAKF
jgi:hypothetical protein